MALKIMATMYAGAAILCGVALGSWSWSVAFLALSVTTAALAGPRMHH